MIIPNWTNIGGTIARDFRGWFKIQSFKDPQSKKGIGQDCPNFQSEDTWPKDEPTMESIIVQPSATKALLGKPLAVRDAIEAIPGKKFILIWGHIEYRDVFPETHMHHEDWCADLISIDTKTNNWTMPIQFERID